MLIMTKSCWCLYRSYTLLASQHRPFMSRQETKNNAIREGGRYSNAQQHIKDTNRIISLEGMRKWKPTESHFGCWRSFSNL